MKSSFYEQMKKATKVKIKSNGKNILIPNSALRQARDLSLALICKEENCSKKDIEANPARYENKLRAAFEGYVEGYAESIIPANNPGRHRARATVSTYEDIFSEAGSYFKNSYPQVTEEKRLQKSLTLKSGLFKVADIFVEGTGKIGPSTINEGKDTKDSDLGMNFIDILNKPQVKSVYVNRYYFYVVTSLLYGLIEKMFTEVSDKNVRDFLKSKLGEKTIKELQDKNTSDAFTKMIRVKMRSLLSEIDINSILK